MNTSVRRTTTGIVVAALALALTVGCSSTPSSSTPTAGELTKIKIGTFPGPGVAPLQVAIDEGIFESYGLDVSIHLAESGAAVIPAVVAGEDQFGYANIISSLAAAEAGLPITIVQDFAVLADDPALDVSRVFVDPKSGITGPEGLEGANIAVNGLQNIGEVTIRMAMENRGIDTSDLTFTQLGFPDMNDALDRGDVDAIWTVEPFASSALAQGYVPVLSNFAEATPGSRGNGHYLATKDYAAANPEIVTAFTEAMAEAHAFCNDNPDAVRATIEKLLGVPKAVADKMLLIELPEDPGVTIDDLDSYVDAALDLGIITKKPDLDAFVYEPSRR